MAHVTLWPWFIWRLPIALSHRWSKHGGMLNKPHHYVNSYFRNPRHPRHHVIVTICSDRIHTVSTCSLCVGAPWIRINDLRVTAELSSSNCQAMVPLSHPGPSSTFTGRRQHLDRYSIETYGELKIIFWLEECSAYRGAGDEEELARDNLSNDSSLALLGAPTLGALTLGALTLGATWVAALWAEVFVGVFMTTGRLGKGPRASTLTVALVPTLTAVWYQRIGRAGGGPARTWWQAHS